MRKIDIFIHTTLTQFATGKYCNEKRSRYIKKVKQTFKKRATIAMKEKKKNLKSIFHEVLIQLDYNGIEIYSGSLARWRDVN